MRRVVSLWLPRFATDRVSRIIPDLRDRPFALVEERQSQPTLIAVNDKAELAGLKPRMALADARAILPSLTTQPSNLVEDRKMLNRIVQWCERYSPWIKAEDTDNPDLLLEGASGAGLWLDITGCAHLYGDEENLLTDMINRIEKIGFTAHAATADTLGCAWAVARFAVKNCDWKIVPPGESRKALAPLAIAALRLPLTTVLSLHEVGLHYIEDLMNIPRGPLAGRYEKNVLLRLDTALGEIAEPLSPVLPKTPLIARLAFAEPIGHLDDIARSTKKLLEELCKTLGKTGQGVRQMILTVYRPNGNTTRIAIRTAYPNREPQHLLKLFAEHLHQIDPEFGIDEITLFAATTEPLQATQTNLQQSVATQNMKCYQAVIDRLANRFGSHNLRQVRFKGSHIPERATGFLPIKKSGDIQYVAKKTLAPRPLRLLRSPEQIEIVAKNTDGLPIKFRWRRVLYRIERCEGPERITPEWWHNNDKNTRDYYRVENKTGQRFWLFANNETTWFIHGIFG